MNRAESQSPDDQEPTTPQGLQRLFAPTDSSGLAFFRISFGCVIMWHAYYFLSAGYLDLFFSRQTYHLTFYGFEWVAPLPRTGMRLVFFAMGLSAFGVALGLCYRVSCVVVFLTYTYSFLAEATLFQNHYYLTCLIAFLMCFIPANRSFSLDALSRRQSGLVPAWCHWLIALQIAIPYFYGGIAKLNYDWLHSKPIGMWMANNSKLPLIGPYLTETWATWGISWFGIVFDLLVVPLLLWRRTRMLAYGFAVCFHLSNSVLFNIDYFPWFMILATPILFPADWPRRLLRLPPVEIPDTERLTGSSPSGKKKLTLGLIGIYVALQLLLPFRHFLYPGNPSWTEEGHAFAWRMMLRRKDVWIRFYATNVKTQETIEFPITQFFNARQIQDISYTADQIVPAAHFIAEQSRNIGIEDVEVRVVVLASLNGRKPQLMIDPELDLTTVNRTWKHQPFILRLTEPLLEEPWAMDVNSWPDAVGIKLPETVNFWQRPNQIQ